MGRVERYVSRVSKLVYDKGYKTKSSTDNTWKAFQNALKIKSMSCVKVKCGSFASSPAHLNCELQLVENLRGSLKRTLAIMKSYRKLCLWKKEKIGEGGREGKGNGESKDGNGRGGGGMDRKRKGQKEKDRDDIWTGQGRSHRQDKA